MRRNGIARIVDNLSMVYTVGRQADPDGLGGRMSEHLAELGTRRVRGQPRVHELAVRDQPPPLRARSTAADRAFLLKTAVKDIAAMHGLLATFMGKPFNDQGGSGTHLHVSLNRDGSNALRPLRRRTTASRPRRTSSSPACSRHAPALMAFLNPTINAYRRIQPDSLAPTHANWG